MQSARRVIIGGSWRRPVDEEAFARGFRELGWEVSQFVQPAGLSVPGQLYRMRLSPLLRDVNARLLGLVARQQPHLVFLQRCDRILPQTIRDIRLASPRTRVFQFHNDDPYAGLRDRVKNRHFLQSLRYADATLVFRPVNVAEARRWGAPCVEVFPPYYVRALHFPEPGTVADADVVFVGHFEDDGRAQIIEAMVAAGLRVALFGTDWDKAPRSCRWIHARRVPPAFGDDYRRALARGRMALVFLSRINRDVWTTRTFEIPACGVAMLTPDNPALRGYFTGDEAIYYRERDLRDAVATAVKWAADPAACARVAAAGHERCLRDGHSELDRTRQLVELWRRLGGESAAAAPAP